MKQLPKKSYYDELGIQPDASLEEVRTAYRKLAKKYHPDRNRGDVKAEEKFKKISEAHRILADSVTRIEYHQKEYIRTAARKAASKQKRGNKKSDSGTIKNAFKKAFSSGFSKPDIEKHSKTVGEMLEMDILLSHSELKIGTTKEIYVVRKSVCPVCNGTGQSKGFDARECKTCHSIGEIPRVVDGKTEFVKCPDCKGRGYHDLKECRHCNGSTVIETKSKIKITIPKRTEYSSRVIVKGEGHAGKKGGPRGDLYLKVIMEENDYFIENGNDLIYELPITLDQILLGGDAVVPSYEGAVKIRLKPYMSEGKMLRIPGKGKNKKGNLIVKIKYFWPASIDDHEEKKIREIVNLPGWKPSTDERGYIRIK